MKRAFFVIAAALALSMLSGCSQSETDALSGKYYLGRSYTQGDHIRSTIVMYFENQTVHIVDSGLSMENDKRISYYGTYSCDENTVTITVSNQEYSGVLANDGDDIKIGSDEFSVTDLDELTDKTREVFENE